MSIILEEVQALSLVLAAIDNVAELRQVEFAGNTILIQYLTHKRERINGSYIAKYDWTYDAHDRDGRPLPDSNIVIARKWCNKY